MKSAGYNSCHIFTTKLLQVQDKVKNFYQLSLYRPFLRKQLQSITGQRDHDVAHKMALSGSWRYDDSGYSKN